MFVLIYMSSADQSKFKKKTSKIKMIKMGLHSFVVHNNAPPPNFSPFYDKSIVLMGKPFFFIISIKKNKKDKGNNKLFEQFLFLII